MSNYNQTKNPPPPLNPMSEIRKALEEKRISASQKPTKAPPPPPKPPQITLSFEGEAEGPTPVRAWVKWHSVPESGSVQFVEWFHRPAGSDSWVFSSRVPAESIPAASFNFRFANGDWEVGAKATGPGGTTDMVALPIVFRSVVTPADAKGVVLDLEGLSRKLRDNGFAEATLAPALWKLLFGSLTRVVVPSDEGKL